MDTKESVRKILGDAEESLANLAAQSVTNRDYDSAAIILGLARELSVIGSKWPQMNAAMQFSLSTSQESSSSRELKPVPTRAGKKSAYPKFFRQGDYLIKIGYSKGEGEYEHKASREVLLLLVERAIRVGVRGKQFTMNEILPLTMPDGGEVPSYQTYLCMNWLRKEGMVNQKGRQGYSISNTNDLTSRVLGRWQQLPQPGQS